jgi:hypothetical protein
MCRRAGSGILDEVTLRALIERIALEAVRERGRP